MARRLAARFIVCFVFIESLFLHLGRLHGPLAMAASRCLFLEKKRPVGFYLCEFGAVEAESSNLYFIKALANKKIQECFERYCLANAVL